MREGGKQLKPQFKGDGYIKKKKEIMFYQNEKKSIPLVNFISLFQS